MRTIRRILKIAQRECGILRSYPIYGFCMIIFPILAIFFFTSMMQDGQPSNLPIGVVDLDNSATSRNLIRTLDGFQTSNVAGYYNNVNEARKAVQRNDIYGFIYIPRNMEEELLASRQPKVSIYYSNAYLTAASLVYRDMKTVASLGSAAVGKAKLEAIGKTGDEIRAVLQPIVLDLHLINNPWLDYNVYLSTVMIPGILMLFILLITPYSLGTELKFNRSKQWMKLAGNDIYVALTGKLLPQFLIFLTIFYGYEFYVYYVLGFPHFGGVWLILLIGLLTVLACQSFGVFIFGLMPSLRMSMSICSLWSVLSFSVCGATYPLAAMHPMIKSFAQLIPLRHYFMTYQICVFNGYPLTQAWFNIMALCIFIALPFFTVRNLRHAMMHYVYIP